MAVRDHCLAPGVDGDPESFQSVDPGWSPTLPARDGAFGLADILAPIG